MFEPNACIKMVYQGVPLGSKERRKEYMSRSRSRSLGPSIYDIPKWCDPMIPENFGEGERILPGPPPVVLYNYLLLFCVIFIRTCT